MPCYKGSDQIQGIYKGGTEIAQVYKGDILVYTNNTVIYLGEGQTFNIASVYKDYKKLTADNFFILSASNIAAVKACPYYPDAGDNWTHDIGGLEKSYDAKTGKLICRFFATAECATIGTKTTNYSNTKAVLVTNPKKLTKLTASDADSGGYGKIFLLPISSYPNFNDYRANNFLIQSLRNWVQPHPFNGDGVSSRATVAFNKVYTRNTSGSSQGGTLECYVRYTDNQNYSQDKGVKVFLYKEGVVTS